MQRKELKRAIKKYSHKTNFYKLGLVRKLLKFQEKREKELILAIPKVICPLCYSHKISIEYDDSEYSADRWLYCDECGESFDDEFGYIDAIDTINYEPWGDMIEIQMSFENPDITTQEWKLFCENEIVKMLNK